MHVLLALYEIDHLLLPNTATNGTLEEQSSGSATIQTIDEGEIDHAFNGEDYQTRLRSDDRDDAQRDLNNVDSQWDLDSDANDLGSSVDSQWDLDSDANDLVDDAQLDSDNDVQPSDSENDIRGHRGSDYQSDGETSTHEITPHTLKRERRHGRVYQKRGTGPFPIDEEAKEAYDWQHHIFNLCILHYFGKALHFTTLPPVHRVLDIGTGTGIWAMDFADAHPECTVIGIHTYPMQPNLVPPNLHFNIDDCETWWFKLRFNFIHHRTWMTTLRSVGPFLERVKNNLCAGGYFEETFIRFPIKWESNPTPEIKRWSELMNKAIDIRQYKEITTSAMQDAGFVDVVEKIYKWPMNKHHKDWKGVGLEDIGKYCHVHMCGKDYIRGLSAVLLCDVLNYSLLEMELLIGGVAKEMISKRNVAAWEVITICGRKNA